MDEIKNLSHNIEKLLGIVTIHQTPTGCIKFDAGIDAESFLSCIHQLQRDINELEKIQNYTNASVKETPKKDMVNHPSHYKNSQFECIDVMLDVFGKEKVEAFCELNAFKYQWRSNYKGTDIQDKEKAGWYLNKYITLKQN